MKNNLLKNIIISIFVGLYLLVSIISTIHVIDFFELSNPRWMAITLAVGFEIGAAASLASLIILEKMNKTLVWSLFITITAMQINGNLYYAFINLENFNHWIDLFGLNEEEAITQKRILAIVSSAILPIIALGFIKSLVDYIKPDSQISTDVVYVNNAKDTIETPVTIDDHIEDSANIESTNTGNISIEPIVLPKKHIYKP